MGIRNFGVISYPIGGRKDCCALSANGYLLNEHNLD